MKTGSRYSSDFQKGDYVKMRGCLENMKLAEILENKTAEQCWESESIRVCPRRTATISLTGPTTKGDSVDSVASRQVDVFLVTERYDRWRCTQRLRQ